MSVSLSEKIPYDFLKFNFSYLAPYVWVIFVEKGYLKLSDLKINAVERGIRKILTFVKCSIPFKIFRKITLKSLKPL